MSKGRRKNQVRMRTAPVSAAAQVAAETHATAEQHMVRADREIQNSDKQTKHIGPSKWTVFWVAAASALATVVYAIMAGWQLQVMSEQLKQMRSGTRAWVGLDSESGGLQTSPLTFDGEGAAHIVCNIAARNFGNYPAQNVFSGTDLLITQDSATVYAREKQVCSEGISTNAGTLVFPGLSRIKWQWPSVVPKAQMIQHPGSGSQFQAFVVGCIWYLDQFGERHHTGFSYRFQKPGTIFGVPFEPSPNTAVEGQWVEFHGLVD